MCRMHSLLFETFLIVVTSGKSFPNAFFPNKKIPLPNPNIINIFGSNFFICVTLRCLKNYVKVSEKVFIIFLHVKAIQSHSFILRKYFENMGTETQ